MFGRICKSNQFGMSDRKISLNFVNIKFCNIVLVINLCTSPGMKDRVKIGHLFGVTFNVSFQPYSTIQFYLCASRNGRIYLLNLCIYEFFLLTYIYNPQIKYAGDAYDSEYNGRLKTAQESNEMLNDAGNGVGKLKLTRKATYLHSIVLPQCPQMRSGHFCCRGYLPCFTTLLECQQHCKQ